MILITQETISIAQVLDQALNPVEGVSSLDTSLEDYVHY